LIHFAKQSVNASLLAPLGRLRIPEMLYDWIMKYLVLRALLGIVLCGVFLPLGTNPQIKAENEVPGGDKTVQDNGPGITQPPGDAPANPSSASVPVQPDNGGGQKEESEQNIALQRKLVRATAWLVIVGSLQAVILIVQAVAFWHTLGAVRTQADLMKVHANHLGNLAAVAGDTAAAAKANAEAAKDGAEATKQSIEMLISKERARIAVRPDKLILRAPGDHLTLNEVTYRISCYGTTPAFMGDSWAAVSVGASEEILPAGVPFPPLSVGPVFQPNPEGIEKNAFVFQDLPLDATDSVNERKLFVHFHGAVKYRDVFGRGRETRFWYFWKVTDLKNFDGTIFAYWSKCGVESDNRES
jgi:hypothetical protein